MVVGIIPARKGSRGVPRKNLKALAGFPLIEWVLAAAKAADTLDKIVVTTDDPEIAKIATGHGVKVLMRSSELARDDTPDLPVFQHALLALRRRWREDDVIVHLRPTAPFVCPLDIDTVVGMLLAPPTAVASVRSVRPASDHPAKMFRQDRERLWPWDSQDHWPNHPRQGLEPAWVAAGYVDAVLAWQLLAGHMQAAPGCILPFYAPPDRTVDLDTPSDFEAAERLAAAHGWKPGQVG